MVLVASEDDECALSATKEMYERLNVIYKQNREKFAFFGCMKAPLKKLQNKFRYQVLMRIKDGEDIIAAAGAACAEVNRGKVFCYIEINPNNLT